MKHPKPFIRILIFLAVLLVPAILWGITGLFGLNKYLDYDTNEKRNKHELAEDLSLGNLTSELEAYYNDRVPFRSVFLSVNRGINTAVDFPYDKGIEPLLLAISRMGKDDPRKADKPSQSDSVPSESSRAPGNDPTKDANASDTATPSGESPSDAHVHDFQVVSHREPDYENYGYTLYRCSCGEEKEEYAEKLIDDSYFPYKQDETGKVVLGRNNWYFISGDMGDYVGYNMPSEEELSDYAAAVQALSDSCAAKGKPFFTLCLPDKSRVYSEYMPTVNNKAVDNWRLKTLNEYIHANTNAKFYYLYDELMAEKKYNQLYYRTDSHWNSYGVLVGMNVFHKVLGQPLIDRNAVATEVRTYTGDLTTMMSIREDEDSVFFNYKPEVTATVQNSPNDSFRYFFDGYAEYISDAPDKRTMVVVGDSFMFLPMDYLCKDFAHTYFVHRSFLETFPADIIKNADILVYSFVERNCNGSFGCLSGLQYLNDLMK